MMQSPIAHARGLLRPNPRRFLAVWYTAWLGYALKGFFINWLTLRQPIRIAWMPVTGPVETLYLLLELVVVGAIAWQAWRFKQADLRLAFLYEWYSLAEISLSLANPYLWTYAMHRMLGVPALWHPTGQILASHIGFVAFYAFMHHGLPLLVLSQVAARPQSLAASKASQY